MTIQTVEISWEKILSRQFCRRVMVSCFTDDSGKTLDVVHFEYPVEGEEQYFGTDEATYLFEIDILDGKIASRFSHLPGYILEVAERACVIARSATWQ